MTDDVECPPDGGDTPGMSDAFIQLSFGMADAQGTRANPNGGEDGDGHEAGQTNENRVSTAVAFLFDANVTVNGEAITPVTPVYFPSVTGPTEAGGTGIDAVWETAPVQTTVENGDYNVIVVANPGDNLWWEQAENQTLGAVRDHIQQKAWKKAESSDGTISYSDFLMSSADEPTEKLTINNNSENEPAKVTVNVERMAARVDYFAQNKYTCTDPAYNDATVEITGATIVNRLTAGSYLLKRVADDVDGANLKYLGDETAANTANYVLDPWTELKTQQNLTGTPFTVNEQNVAAAGLYDDETYIPTRSDNPEDWAGYCKAGVDATENNYLRVGYALENTTGQLETSLNYNTGIVFKAQFHPKGVTGYTDGQTFFTYNGTIYPTLTDMMGQLDGKHGHEDFSAYADEQVYNCLTWLEVKLFGQTLVNDPTGYGDYLINYTNGKDLSQEIKYDSDKDELTWTYYLLHVLGVGEAGSITEINLKGINTRAVLFDKSDEKLRTYYNGQCYYIWWLRHSNDGDEETNGVMEYAVVRNNIYKVNVNSIYSLGGDIPDNQQLDARVYVNKWSLLDRETLPM